MLQSEHFAFGHNSTIMKGRQGIAGFPCSSVSSSDRSELTSRGTVEAWAPTFTLHKEKTQMLLPTHTPITEGCPDHCVMSASPSARLCEPGRQEPYLLPASPYPPDPEQSLTSREDSAISTSWMKEETSTCILHTQIEIFLDRLSSQTIAYISIYVSIYHVSVYLSIYLSIYHLSIIYLFTYYLSSIYLVYLSISVYLSVIYHLSSSIICLFTYQLSSIYVSMYLSSI